MELYVKYSELVGSVLKYHREKLNLSQGTLCEVLDVTSSTYSRYECGETSLTVTQLSKACRALGVTTSEVLSEVNSFTVKLLEKKDVAVAYGDETEELSGYIQLTGKGLVAVLKTLR